VPWVPPPSSAAQAASPPSPATAAAGRNQKVIPLGNGNVEDERRLFYVAVTQATSNLIVSFVRHAVRSRVEPSQFIEEMGLRDAEEKRANVLS
jgi:superfamily I DNA/RNA helicase